MSDPLDDDRTLAFLRRAVAVVAAIDATSMAVRTVLDAPVHRSWIAAAGWAGVLADQPAVVAAIGAVTLALIALFALRRGSWAPGLAALAGLRVQHEVFAATRGIFYENYYQTGAFLLGWVGGALVARAAGARPRESRAQLLWSERLSVTGGTAMLAATWMNAGISKLRSTGLSWADGDEIRLVALRHFAPGHATWRLPLVEWVVARPSVAAALAVSTLVFELGAFGLLFGPRVRAACATALISFHVGTFLLSGIFFVDAVALAALVSYPWIPLVDRLRGRRRDEGPAPAAWAPSPASLRRAALAVAAGAAVLGLLPFARLRQRAHYIDRGKSDPATSVAVMGPRPKDRFGPLRVGEGIDAVWRVQSIAIEGASAAVDLVDAGGPAITFDISVAGRDVPLGPFGTGGAAISYRSTQRPQEDCDRAGKALVEALRRAAPSLAAGEAVTGWMRAATTEGS
jgi:hypothetical protein